MKKFLTPLLLIAILFSACTANRLSTTGTSISSTELKKLSDRGKVSLIDARTDGEYKEGHIPGATLMDVLQEANFLQQIQSLDKSKPYVVYCRSGKRSKRAMELMLQNGFKQVSDLDGGIQGWTGPTEK
jgi:rhodanese-related sulfurtransferase